MADGQNRGGLGFLGMVAGGKVPEWGWFRGGQERPRGREIGEREMGLGKGRKEERKRGEGGPAGG